MKQDSILIRRHDIIPKQKNELGQSTYNTTSEIRSRSMEENAERGTIEQIESHESIKQQWDKFRTTCDTIVNDTQMQILMFFLIISNAIFMGIGTYDFVTENPEHKVVFENIDTMFLVIFTVELMLQFVVEGINLFFDGWLVFDFGVVMISWIGELLSGNQLHILRSIRITRALRLVNRISTLKILVSTLLESLPSMYTITFLLVLINYIFGVIVTDLYKNLHDTADEHGIGEEFLDHFRNLWRSMFTLFQMATLDGWAEICRELMKFHPQIWVLIISYIVISGVVTLNLVVAVICSSLQNVIDESEENEKDTAETSRLGSVNLNDAQIDIQEPNIGTQQENGCENMSQIIGQISTITTEIEELKKDQEDIQYTMDLICSQLIIRARYTDELNE